MNKDELVVGAAVPTRVGDLHQIAARFSGPGIDDEVWFRSTDEFAPIGVRTAEAFLAVGLQAAMKEGLRLRVTGAISQQLMGNLVEYQKILSEWYADYLPVEIVADAVVAEPEEAADPGAAFFFSGGVDSFHTYLGNRDGLTHGLFLYGADIKLDETACRELTSRQLNGATAEMGVRFIEVESNLLDFTEQYSSWAYHSHGALLPSVAKLFGNRFRNVSLASSYPAHKLVPWGSHPVTDPLWSGGGLEVLHFGGNATRFDKVCAVGKDELARRFIRVCWENVEGAYNCCRCEKCLRTMVALRIAGLLDGCPAFPEPLDLGAVAKVRYSSEGNRTDWHWNVLALRFVDDPDLEAALEAQQAGSATAWAVKEFSRHHKAMFESPEWQRLLPVQRNKLLNNLKAHSTEWFAEVLSKEVESNQELSFETLWHRKRKWLINALRHAEAGRRRDRLRSALRRLGIGARKIQPREDG